MPSLFRKVCCRLYEPPEYSRQKHISFTYECMWLPPDQGHAKVPLLSSAIECHIATLESLHIPAKCLESTVAVALRLPRLRSLVLGEGLLGRRQLPLIQLLTLLPKLRSLEIAPSVTTGQEFFVWPENYEVNPDHRNSDILPELESLVIVNPQCKDLFLNHLPRSLKHLSITHSARRLWLQFEDAPWSLLSPQAVDILRQNNLQSLRSLRFFLTAGLSIQLLETIGAECPLLETLQIFGSELGLTFLSAVRLF